MEDAARARAAQAGLAHADWTVDMQVPLPPLCNEHADGGENHRIEDDYHLRVLKALVEIEKEEWARKMQQLLRRALSRGEFRT